MSERLLLCARKRVSVFFPSSSGLQSSVFIVCHLYRFMEDSSAKDRSNDATGTFYEIVQQHAVALLQSAVATLMAVFE